jgi:hypothetical protein
MDNIIEQLPERYPNEKWFVLYNSGYNIAYAENNEISRIQYCSICGK